MKQNEIIEGKRLIADFLGWENIRDNIYRVPFLYPFYNMNDSENTGWTETSLSEMPFNTSLDWLVPVIVKIRLIPRFIISIEIKENMCLISARHNPKYTDNPKAFSVSRYGKTKVEALCLTVIEFIKIYTLQTEK